MSGTWHFQLFGGFRAWSDAWGDLALPSGRASELIARLVLAAEAGCARADLADEFWPGVDPALARQRLRQTLTDLRRSLNVKSTDFEALFAVSRHHIRVFPKACDSDVAAFSAAVRAGDLRSADRLYRGDLMPGCNNPMIVRERDRLRIAQLNVLQSLAAECENTGDVTGAVDAATRLAALEPDDEVNSLLLIRLLLKSGSVEVARRQYRKLLRDFVAADGSGKRLPIEIRRDVRRWFADVSAEASKNLSVASSSVSVAQFVTPASNLPHARTLFFGRQEETAALDRLLTGSPPVRLITLVGPAGVGKTRLAIEIAERSPKLARYFVSLADIRDASLMCDKILEALGGPSKSWLPALEQTVVTLSQLDAPVLLIIDNIEHLLDSDETRQTVDRLLAGVPRLTCLATSRQPLGIGDERVVLLPPLATPARPAEETPESLTRSDGAALLVDRMQSVRSSFRVTSRNAASVAELCRKLDGLPLALEIAATWARTLTPAEIVAQLATSERRRTLLTSRRALGPPRHASLQVAVDWSYSRLPASLQTFFCRLHVFHGSFTEEAAAAVCEEPLALERLARLEERSFVIAFESGDTMRYRLLETLREFGREQLGDTESDELVRRHADYFLQMAEQEIQAISGPTQAAVIARLDLDQDNFRVALQTFDSLIGQDGPDCLRRLVMALRWFWVRRGLVEEGTFWLERAAAPTDPLGDIDGNFAADEGDPLLYACVLQGLAFFLRDQNASRRVRNLHEQVRLLYKKAGDVEGEAQTLNALGSLAFQAGDYREACLYLEDSLALLPADGRHATAGVAMYYLGAIHNQWGKFEEAAHLFEATQRLYEQSGYTDRAGIIGSQALLAWNRSDLEQAEKLYQESLALRRKQSYRSLEASCLTGLGAIAAVREEFAEARRLHDEALLLVDERNDPRLTALVLGHRGVCLLRAGDYPDAEIDFARALRLRRAVGDRWGTAHTLEHQGDLRALAHSDWHGAIALWAEASEIRAALEAPVPPVERPWREACQAKARAALGDAAFDTLWRSAVARLSDL